MSAVQSLAAKFSSAFTFRPSSSSSDSNGESSNWWKTAIVYQIWPASFKDGNSDGLGDLPGIISKLDYLEELGVDTIWLSPMYASPQVDMGYDISNYEDIYPPYGTLKDMDVLIKGLHDRGMRIILDLVINHTSNEHAWFQESRKSRENAKSDWYIWKDPKIGKDGKRQPPNNWGAMFGGSAWKYVAERDQYYLHLFAPEQPDLNWENETTRKAIYDSALRFWFEKGVDGFRVDTCNLYSKVQTFPDGALNPRFPSYGNPSEYCRNGPRIHEFYKEIREQVLDKYGDPLMVGELGGSTFNEILDYVSSERRELSMIFDFSIVTLGEALVKPPHLVHSYPLPELKTAFQLTQDLVANTKAWSTIFMENHDIPRSVSRHATTNPLYHNRASKLLAMLLSTLSGTLFLYQGQEIGMTNIPETWSPSDLRDLSAINYWNEMKRQYPHDKAMLRRAWRGIVAVSRDNARTPVQWSAEPNAGFSPPGTTPWMRVNDNYTEINVADQLEDSNSVRSFWKHMLDVRRQFAEVLMHGEYKVHDLENLKTFSIEKREPGGGVAMVVLNFSDEVVDVVVPEALRATEWELVVANVEEPGAGKLGPWEGRMYVEKGNPGGGWVVVKKGDEEGQEGGY